MRQDEYEALPEEIELTCPYCGHREEHPRPYVWHKSADDILDSLAAFCQRISDSGR